MKLTKFDRNASRVMDGQKLVGMALKLANGRWGAFSPGEQRLSELSFASDKDVLSYFKRAALKEMGE